jgi:hypothetical protein
VVLLSLGDFGVATALELGDAGVEAAGLVPGEYLLVSKGLVSRAQLAEGALEFEAGSAALTVRAAADVEVEPDREASAHNYCGILQTFPGRRGNTERHAGLGHDHSARR